MSHQDKFIDISLKGNIDIYYQRQAILHALKNSLHHFKGTLLDAGCGKMPYRAHILKNSSVSEYVGLDIESAIVYDEGVKPDFQWDGKNMPFGNNSFDCALATEVLEHVPLPEVFLSEVYRVLKPGSVFFFTVPFLWPLHEIPHDEYRYTPFSLQRHLETVGFTNVQIHSLGGWNASLAQMLGLWLKRSPMHPAQRKVLSYLCFPFYKYLIRRDQKLNKKGEMITGLSGIASKPPEHVKA